MKKILIVDDEFIVRVGLRSITNWEENGYEIIGEAENGEKALKLIDQFRPDIVLLDLKMEPVDGMEVMRQSMMKYPHTKFIVLSSYNDFDNVKNAMKLGASEYIFKLTVTETEILRVLGEVKPDNNTGAGISNQNKETIKSSIIHRLIHNENISHEKLIDELCALDGRIIWKQKYKIMLVDIDNFFLLHKSENYGDSDLLKFAVNNIADEVARESIDGIVINHNDGQIIILIPVKKQNDKEIQINIFYEKLFECIKRYLGCEVSCIVSDIVNDLSALKTTYYELNANLKKRFFQTKNQNKLMHLSDREIVAGNNVQIQALNDYMNNGDIQRAKEELRVIFKTISEQQKVEKARAVLAQIYATLCLCKENQFEIEKYLDENGVSLFKGITKYDRLNDIKSAMYDFLEQYDSYLQSEGKQCKKEILDIKQYVVNNLNQDLSVKVLALMLGMNESYFSHFFKKETGMSFVDYVTSKRVSKACDLLVSTQLRINEIALEVGFDNTNYFSVVFKKVTGTNPQEYRRKN